MKRVLILASECKPFHSPEREIASQRPYYFARYLPSAGWDCTVICASRELTERTIEGEGWRIISIPQGELTGGRKVWQNLMEKQSHRFLRKGLSWWFIRRGDNGVVWAPQAMKRALEIHRTNPFDVVVGEHSPDGGLEAASRFFHQTGTPYCIDLRDPIGILFDDVCPRHLPYFLDRSRGAKLIITTSASWIETFESVYKIPTWSLSHGYDPQELDAAVPMTFEKPTVVYTGSTYADQDWKTFGRALAATKGKIRLWSAGHGASRIEEALIATQAIDYAEIHGRVPHEKALSAQKGASALLLISHCGGCISGRTFEYIGSGNPIIYFPADGSELEKRIRMSNAQFCIPANEAELTNLFYQMGTNTARWERRQSSNGYMGHTRAEQAARLAQILDAVCFGSAYPPQVDI